MRWIMIKNVLFFSLKSISCLGSCFENNFFFKNKKSEFSFQKKKKALECLKNFQTILSEFPSCFIMRIRLKKNELFLWEIWNKIKCIVPESMRFQPCYGEKTVDYNQNLENSKTIVSIYKKFLLKFNHCKFLFDSENVLVYENPFNLNEQILNGINCYFLYTFISFFSKIFWNSGTKILRNKAYKKKEINKYFEVISWNFKKNKNFLRKEKIFLYRYIKKKKKYSISPLRIFRSSKHGFGILAEKNLRKLTIINEYKGHYLDQNIENPTELCYKLTGIDLFLFRLNSRSILDATIKGNYCRLINHSCKPNCFTRIIFHGQKNHILLITRQKIFSNEELSYNYCIDSEILELNPTHCFCGELPCKGDLNY